MNVKYERMRLDGESPTVSEPSDEGLESYKICWKIDMYCKHYRMSHR